MNISITFVTQGYVLFLLDAEIMCFLPVCRRYEAGDENLAESVPGHADVVVIGGGVAGCSTLYQLAKQGLCSAVLLEKDALTAGTTWHTAGRTY